MATLQIDVRRSLFALSLTVVWNTKFVHIDKNKSSGQPAGNSGDDSAAQGPIIGCANVFGSRVYLPVVPVVINPSGTYPTMVW